MVTDTKMRAAKRKNIVPPAKASKAKKVDTGCLKKTVIKKSNFFTDYLRLQTVLRKCFVLKIKIGTFAL